MNRTRRSLAAALLGISMTTMLMPSAALAEAHRLELRRDANGSRDNGGRAARISRDEAAGIARRAVGGRVLGVELKGNRYYVRLLVDGKRVRTVQVDARSGELR